MEIEPRYSINLNCFVSDISKTSFNNRRKVVLYRMNFSVPVVPPETFWSGLFRESFLAVFEKAFWSKTLPDLLNSLYHVFPILFYA